MPIKNAAKSSILVDGLQDDEQTDPPTTCNGTFNRRMKQFIYAAEISPTRRSPRSADGSNAASNTSSPAPSLSPAKRKHSTPPPTESTNASATPKKRRPSAKYVGPSRYAHLSPLVDNVRPGLTLIFVGVNPGISTAVAGHAYAHPSNRFWHLLHVSGLTPERKLSPREDRELPALYNYGNTNIVGRPTRDQSELSKEEMVAGASVLERKLRELRPEAVCIVGKGIWEAIWRHKFGRPMKKDEFHYGWQDEENNMGKDTRSAPDDGEAVWNGSRVFVATSTSGQAASVKPAEREAIWKVLGDWAQAKRAGSTIDCDNPPSSSAG